jgi:tRNA dimethylallyltransferase
LISPAKIIFIVGPTAVGKSDVALALARHIQGEIISCDAMQVYKEISIATSKPSPAMLKKIPHHLVNIQSVTEEFDVARFNALATGAIASIIKKGKVPIITGGSGLYMQILLDGIFKGGAKDPKVRAELEKEAQEKGNEALYAKLGKVDPAAAAKIHPQDRRRLIRALEVYATMRQPISTAQKSREGLWGKFDIRIFALNRLRAELYARINQRVDAMLKEGLIEEMAPLDPQKLSLTASRIIGVKEIDGYRKGEYDIERARYLIQLNTRHLAKRQLTWFRKDKRLEWITLEEHEPPEAAADKIREALNA